MTLAVLDASAVLALIHDEPGAETVLDSANGAYLHPINLTEVLTVVGRTASNSAESVMAVLEGLGVRLRGHHFLPEDAAFAAQLARSARQLSLGDRCCLAFTAATAGAHVLTADKAWDDLDLEVEIHQIR